MGTPGPLDLDNPQEPTKPPAEPTKPSTTTSTTSSGGGSSAPASPFPDAQDFEVRQFGTFASAYAQLWGEQPHPGYIASAVKAGLNLEEFLENERKKPAFRKTKTYRDRGSSLAEMLHGLGVV